MDTPRLINIIPEIEGGPPTIVHQGRTDFRIQSQVLRPNHIWDKINVRIISHWSRGFILLYEACCNSLMRMGVIALPI